MGDKVRKFIRYLICFSVVVLFVTGCSSSDKEKVTAEEIALIEAKEIAERLGYSLESFEGVDILIGDAEVFKMIENASIAGGYSQDDFTSMTEHRRVIEYGLKEKSKQNKPIILGVIIDEERAIGAYLSCEEYKPNIKPIDFKE